MDYETGLARLKKLVEKLEKKRGRHTELISLYIPAGFPLNEISSLIAQEISLTQNVKSKTVRKNVTDALTKIQQHLKLYKKTPENGLVIFCGNVSEEEGKTDIKLWAVEPPEPVTVKIYWCDQRFELEPLRQQLKEKDLYGLIVMDTKEATIGLLKGKSVTVLKHLYSLVPGKFRKGGQSAQRFQRVREGLVNDWFKKIGEVAVSSIPEDVKGVLLGGPGVVKEHFLKSGHLKELGKKVIGVVDTGDTSESGLEELVEKGSEFLKESKVVREKAVCKKFFEELARDGKAAYGIRQVLRALESGAVETLLISEDLNWRYSEVSCSCGYRGRLFHRKAPRCPECGSEARVVWDMDVVDALEEISKHYATEVVLISSETREGEQFLNLGGIGALLRWKN